MQDEVSKSTVVLLIGATLGAMAGWLYWHEVGCASGTCAITSKPLNSTLYGMVMGALLANLLFDGKKQETHTEKKPDGHEQLQ